MVKIMGVVAGLLMGPRVLAATFYVDPVTGDDVAHSGRAEDQAWRTVAKVNGQSFAPGDTILFKRDGIWRETLSVPSSGTAGHVITFGAYGAGADPVISGADVVTGLVQQTSYRWTAPLAVEPAQVFVDGTRGLRVATTNEVTADRCWHWAANILTVYGSTESVPPVVEASVRPYCIVVNQSYVAVEHLTAQRAAFAVLKHGATDGLTVRQCHLTEAFVFGLHSAEDGPHNHGLIEGCEISDCGGCGLQFAGRMSGWVIRDNHIHHCCQLHEGLVGAAQASDGGYWQEWSAGLKYWAGPGRDGYLGALTIERNVVEDCGPQFDEGTEPHKRSCGIWIDESFQPTARTVIRRNLVRRNRSKGIFLEKADDCDVFSNLCYHNATIKFTANIMVESNMKRPCRNNRIYHNTCVEGWWVLALNFYKGANLHSNVFHNNIAVSSNLNAKCNLYVAVGATNDGINSSGNVFTHNCFGPQHTMFIIWGTGLATYDAWETAYGGPTFSVRANPLFRDAASGDYRLQSASPCRGTGTNLTGIVGQDYNGVPFDPQASNFGAYADRFPARPTARPAVVPNQ